MTLDEAAQALPNGFHDAKIENIVLDYNSKRTVIDLQLWTGDLSSQEKGAREMRRRARLTLSGVLFFAVDTPDPRYLNLRSLPTITSYGTGIPPNGPMSFSGEVPGNTFLYWFYLSSWNSFIHCAVDDANIQVE